MPSLTPAQHRQQLRKTLRQARRALTPLQQRHAAQQLQKRLAVHPWLRRARHIALYLANDGEIDPQRLSHWLQRHGKQVYLPVLKRWPHTAMQFQRINHTRWQTNRFGIAEPRYQHQAARRIECLDVLLMPLVGFDPHGNRLGMGGGFYDRLLGKLHKRAHWQGPKRIGLAHECQKVAQLPIAAWDVPLHGIASDQAWYSIAKKDQQERM